MSVRDLLKAGAKDMSQELGEYVTLSRNKKKYAEVKAIISTENMSYAVDLGGAQKQITATAMIQSYLLPQRPAPGDVLSLPCADFINKFYRYSIVSVSGGNLEPFITLQLSE